MQEIFQDAAQNAYRTFGRNPMAFLETHHYGAVTTRPSLDGMQPEMLVRRMRNAR